MGLLRRIAVGAAIPVASMIFALTVPTGAQAGTWYGAGSCTARGQYATCVASGNASHPSGIYVHVNTGVNQRITVQWSVVCWKGTGAGSRSGQFTVYTPATHKISHPYYHPAGCSVASDAQIHKGRYLHLHNKYHRWS
jgi:hypothetical protein